MSVRRSHQNGDRFLRLITKPWIRVRIAPGARLRFRKPLEDFIFIAGEFARPKNEGEILLRFKVQEDRLKIRAIVSDELRNSDLVHVMARMAWHFEIAWTKLEVLRGAQ